MGSVRLGEVGMVKLSRSRILAGIAAIAISAAIAGELVAQTDSAAVVKERQELMKEMGRAFGPLVAILKGESTDFAAAAASAEIMNANAQRIPDKFPEGSGREAVAETRAKPVVWSDRATFEANARKLAEESAKLAEIARTEDAEAFQTQFQALGKACGGCHRGKPDEGGDFRFAKGE